MVTKFSREPEARETRIAPFQSQLERTRPALKKRWNVIILVTPVLIVLLHGLGPDTEVDTTPLRGIAVVEERELRPAESGPAHWVRVSILHEESGFSVWTSVDAELWERYVPGARFAVLYEAPQGLAPPRVRELGVVALPAGEEYP